MCMSIISKTLSFFPKFTNGLRQVKNTLLKFLGIKSNSDPTFNVQNNTNVSPDDYDIFGDNDPSISPTEEKDPTNHIGRFFNGTLYGDDHHSINKGTLYGDDDQSLSKSSLKTLHSFSLDSEDNSSVYFDTPDGSSSDSTANSSLNDNSNTVQTSKNSYSNPAPTQNSRSSQNNDIPQAESNNAHPSKGKSIV